MNTGFYAAATSAYYQQQHLNIIANNTANINTVGFKAETPVFSELMRSNLEGINGAQLTRGAGARLEKADIDFAQGALYETSSPFDYAISGEGFFALQDMVTGEVSYTRAGNFQLSQYQDDYYLTDSTGQRFVLDAAGAPIPAARMPVVRLDENGEPIEVELDENGEPIEDELLLEEGARPPIDQAAKLPVGIYVFDQKNGMLHLEDGRFIPTAKNGLADVSERTPEQGWLESSNADLAQSMSKVIEAQRAFSYALAMVRTQDEVETTINGLRG